MRSIMCIIVAEFLIFSSRSDQGSIEVRYEDNSSVDREQHAILRIILGFYSFN